MHASYFVTLFVQSKFRLTETGNYSHSISSGIGGSIEIKLPKPWLYIAYSGFIAKTSSSKKRDFEKSGSFNG